MRYLILALTLFSFSFSNTIEPISKEIEKRMRAGNSYRDNCPVKLKDLRYLRLKYLGFDGRTHTGEMIVHKSVAKDVVKIFDELYKIKYPINKMELVSKYKGSDYKSIEADNTSAFNCRAVTGNSHKWSNHAYGQAIDLNPIENPYISRSGRIAHKKSLKFAKNREYLRKKFGNKQPAYRAILTSNSQAVKIFKRHGWRWGGNWHSIKDYQHFEKSKKSTLNYIKPPKKIEHKKSDKTTNPKDLFKELEDSGGV